MSCLHLIDKNVSWRGKLENQKPPSCGALSHGAGTAQNLRFIPISHKFSLEKRQVESGTRPVLVVAENNVPQAAASAECVRKQGKERDKCWIVLSPWAGQEWLELLL